MRYLDQCLRVVYKRPEKDITDEISRACHLLCLWLDMRSVSVYSLLDNRTRGRFHAPTTTLEAKMDKNSVSLRVPGILMARSDRKVVQGRARYVRKRF
jgi:hypothetical protein